METRAVYTEEVATDIVFPNITICRQYADGVLYGYRAYPNEGYVMYDTTDNNIDFDAETGEEISVTYYYTMAGFPANFNFANFTWVAVPRSEVDENYIFGGGDNDHEVM